MRTAQKMNVALPVEMTALIKSTTASGEHTGEPARDGAIERWLKNEVAAAYDELEQTPHKAIPIAMVKRNICSRRNKTNAKI